MISGIATTETANTLAANNPPIATYASTCERFAESMNPRYSVSLMSGAAIWNTVPSSTAELDQRGGIACESFQRIIEACRLAERVASRHFAEACRHGGTHEKKSADRR